MESTPVCEICGFIHAYRCYKCERWLCLFCSPNSIKSTGLCITCQQEARENQYKYKTWDWKHGLKLDLPHEPIITMWHITPARNLGSIKRKGLIAGARPTFRGMEDKIHEFIFLDSSPEEAKNWASLKQTGVKAWLLLKVKVKRANITLTSWGWATTTPIPPGSITVVEEFDESTTSPWPGE